MTEWYFSFFFVGGGFSSSVTFLSGSNDDDAGFTQSDAGTYICNATKFGLSTNVEIEVYILGWVFRFKKINFFINTVICST